VFLRFSSIVIVAGMAASAIDIADAEQTKPVYLAEKGNDADKSRAARRSTGKRMTTRKRNPSGAVVGEELLIMKEDDIAPVKRQTKTDEPVASQHRVNKVDSIHLKQKPVEKTETRQYFQNGWPSKVDGPSPKSDSHSSGDASKGEGGRHTPFFTNYRPQFYFGKPAADKGLRQQASPPAAGETRGGWPAKYKGPQPKSDQKEADQESKKFDFKNAWPKSAQEPKSNFGTKRPE